MTSVAARALVLLVAIAGGQLAESAAAPDHAPDPAAASGAEASFEAGADAATPLGARLFAVAAAPGRADLAVSFVPETRLGVDDALVLRSGAGDPLVVRVAAVEVPPGIVAVLTFHPEGRAGVPLALEPGAWALVPLDATDVHASLRVEAAPGASPPGAVVRALVVLGA